MTPPITPESQRITNRICELRTAGMGWDAIGAQFGLTKQAARARWLRAREGTRTRAAIRQETARALRGLREENRRLRKIVAQMKKLLEGM